MVFAAAVLRKRKGDRMALLNRFGFRTRELSHKGSIVLSTPRLTLRPFTVRDEEAMFQNWASDPEVTRYLLWRAHLSSAETKDVLLYWQEQYRRKDFYEWAIVPKGETAPIGSCGASKVRGKRLVLEIGYCLGKNWWGHGYAPEAAAELLRFFFDEVGCREIIAMHEIGNEASGRVMEKCGMLPLDVPPQRVRSDHGMLRCKVYGITEKRFNSIREESILYGSESESHTESSSGEDSQKSGGFRV